MYHRLMLGFSPQKMGPSDNEGITIHFSHKCQVCCQRVANFNGDHRTLILNNFIGSAINTQVNVHRKNTLNGAFLLPPTTPVAWCSHDFVLEVCYGAISVIHSSSQARVRMVKWTAGLLNLVFNHRTMPVTVHSCTRKNKTWRSTFYNFIEESRNTIHSILHG